MSQFQHFPRLLLIVVHRATVRSWLNLTVTLIWDCTFSPIVLWAVGILFPKRLWVHRQSTVSRDIWILYDRRRWVSSWTPRPHNPTGCWLWCMFRWIDLMLYKWSSHCHTRWAFHYTLPVFRLRAVRGRLSRLPVSFWAHDNIVSRVVYSLPLVNCFFENVHRFLR